MSGQGDTINIRTESIQGQIGLVGWIAICIGAGVTAPAWGDVVYTSWMDAHNFDYEIKHMPELDQGRVPDPPNAWGLLNNGKHYRVPTSTMNMIMYIARHGHPQLAPGVKNWQDQSTYNEASVNILVLGMKMGTSGTEGTKGNGWLAGARAWFLSRRPVGANLWRRRVQASDVS